MRIADSNHWPFSITASVDVGIAIYNRYSMDVFEQGSVSYVAHVAGALAGLTIGLLVLKNFEQKLHEQLMWWVALGVYVACIAFALVYNVFYWIVLGWRGWLLRTNQRNAGHSANCHPSPSSHPWNYVFDCKCTALSSPTLSLISDDIHLDLYCFTIERIAFRLYRQFELS